MSVCEFFIGRGAKEKSGVGPSTCGGLLPSVTVHSEDDNSLNWSTTEFLFTTKTKQKNIVKVLPGLKICAKDITDKVSASDKII